MHFSFTYTNLFSIIFFLIGLDAVIKGYFIGFYYFVRYDDRIHQQMNSAELRESKPSSRI